MPSRTRNVDDVADPVVNVLEGLRATEAMRYVRHQRWEPILSDIAIAMIVVFVLTTGSLYS